MVQFALHCKFYLHYLLNVRSCLSSSTRYNFILLSPLVSVENARPGKDFEEKNLFQALLGCLGFDFLVASCSLFSRTVGM